LEKEVETMKFIELELYADKFDTQGVRILDPTDTRLVTINMDRIISINPYKDAIATTIYYVSGSYSVCTSPYRTVSDLLAKKRTIDRRPTDYEASRLKLYDNLTTIGGHLYREKSSSITVRWYYDIEESGIHVASILPELAVEEAVRLLSK